MTVAFLFPGQGSQSVGMLDAYQKVSCVRDVFAQASDIMACDLWSLMSHASSDWLSLTENTQPLMLVADVAIWRFFQESGMIDQESDIWLAGHSLGEYAALVAAGVLDFSDALRLVMDRARLMQDALPAHVGGMAAVLGLSADVVCAVCQRLTQPTCVVEAVNFNTDSQTVVAGHRVALEKAQPVLKEAGAKKVIFLDLSVPAHSSLMNGVSDSLGSYLQKVAFRCPQYPVVHNLTADICQDPEVIRSLLARQVNHPVLWNETMKLMQKRGVQRFVQCGPGNVLVGFLRKMPHVVALSSSDYCPVHKRV